MSGISVTFNDLDAAEAERILRLVSGGNYATTPSGSSPGIATTGQPRSAPPPPGGSAPPPPPPPQTTSPAAPSSDPLLPYMQPWQKQFKADGMKRIFALLGIAKLGDASAEQRVWLQQVFQQMLTPEQCGA